MDFRLYYSKHIILDLPETASREDILNAYAEKLGSGQAIIADFVKNVSATRDFVEDITIIE